MVNIVRNSCVHRRGTEIRGGNLTFKNFCRMHKVMDGSPLTRKVTYARQVVIQGQGRSPNTGYCG